MNGNSNVLRIEVAVSFGPLGEPPHRTRKLGISAHSHELLPTMFTEDLGRRAADELAPAIRDAIREVVR